MDNLPKRKTIRVEDYDYASPGSYFITICTLNRDNLLWRGCRGDLRSPANLPLSDIGKIVDNELQKLSSVYSAVKVDKYCIMPDHVHLIISISADECGRPQVAPTISRIVQQFKGAVSKQAGRAIWQKSFYDHGIRNRRDYDEIWEYINNNPLKYM